jgi:hypothetical protein
MRCGSFSLHISGRGWARWNIDVSTWIDTRSLDDDDDDDDASLGFMEEICST